MLRQTRRALRLSAVVSAGAAATIALALSVPVTAQESETEASAEKELTKGEKKLARLLENRVAGEPQSCIRTRLNDRLQVIDKTAYVYGRGNTIYVQRTRHPDKIDSDDILVTRIFNPSQLCRLETVTTVDRFTGFFTGAVFFDEFIPYTRVKDAKDQDADG